jgi:hypothetical protein
MNPSKAMIDAGNQFASDAIYALCAHNMNGLGGSKDWNEWLNKEFQNKDLLIKYACGEISAVEGIYLAMERLKS